jgi:hypothetical protein
LRAAVDAKLGPDVTFEQREAMALELSNEATRLFLNDELVAIADSHGEHVEVDGTIYKRHEPGTVRYYTLCGSLEIERCTYREVGLANGPTIVPMELEAGLVERATPALAYRIALGYSKDHMRSCHEDMKADHRCPPSRSTLERIAKTIGTQAKQSMRQIEARVRSAEAVPEGAVAISLGLDRTTVPMEEDLPPGKPAHRKKPRREPYQRREPQPVEVNYRMAYVGTVAFHDCCGEELATRCYAAGADEGPADIVRRMMADLRHAVRQVPRLAVGIIQDGAPELWNLLVPAVESEPLVSKHYEAIDRYHVTERLADVLRLVEPDLDTRKAQLTGWNESLNSSQNAIYRIRDTVRGHHAAALDMVNQELAEAIEPHLTYLENNASRMRYVHLIERGLPVGSGVTEGACKSTIKMRTNGCGQRWRPRPLIEIKVPISSRHKFVVPVAVELVWYEREVAHLRLRDFHSGRVFSLVELCLHTKAGCCPCVSYEIDDCLECNQGLRSPVRSDVTEQAMLDLVPLTRSRREVAHPNP